VDIVNSLVVSLVESRVRRQLCPQRGVMQAAWPRPA
jgi:hypothetical protein